MRNFIRDIHSLTKLLDSSVRNSCADQKCASAKGIVKAKQLSSRTIGHHMVAKLRMIGAVCKHYFKLPKQVRVCRPKNRKSIRMFVSIKLQPLSLFKNPPIR